MSHYWLIIVLSCLGSAKLQYINTGGPAANNILDPLNPTLHYPLPYSSFLNLAPPASDSERYQSQTNLDNEQFYPGEDREQRSASHKERHYAQIEMNEQPRQWPPNFVDAADKTVHIRNDEQGTPYLIQRYEGISGTMDNNSTDLNTMDIDKKSFSPWGGKRDRPRFEQNNMWTWKRAANIREPTMPKRVRFSPWGGKRSGQLIYKPGTKGSKIIFSNSIPELTRIISDYSPNGHRFNLAGFQLIPTLDKQHPIRVLAMSTRLEDRITREAMPFNEFVESSKMYKAGHPYADVNLKKDGKRKVKFSAWGGKRSPPIIGPIWTPPSQIIKDNTLDAILLIRNNQPGTDKTTKAL